MISFEEIVAQINTLNESILKERRELITSMLREDMSFDINKITLSTVIVLHDSLKVDNSPSWVLFSPLINEDEVVIFDRSTISNMCTDYKFLI